MDIGIIGGADGPTAIFVASSVNWPLIGLAAVAIIGVVIYLLLRKRKHRNV